MAGTQLSLDRAVDLTRTGDLWLFRGRSAADQAIRVLTNAPVNHVGMAVVLDDMPPLMWHAELGKGLLDVWTGTHHRGVQLHDLRARSSSGPVATSSGRGCGSSTRRSIRRWRRRCCGPSPASTGPVPGHRRIAGPVGRGRVRRTAAAETTYCAEVVAATYAAMGLLADRRPTNYYDPGRFSGQRRRRSSHRAGVPSRGISR